MRGPSFEIRVYSKGHVGDTPLVVIERIDWMGMQVHTRTDEMHEHIEIEDCPPGSLSALEWLRLMVQGIDQLLEQKITNDSQAIVSGTYAKRKRA
jgi:hypothetical protein